MPIAAAAIAAPTARPTAIPTATPTPRPPTPTPEPAGLSFGNGTHRVGEAVVAGATYRTRTAAAGCYWARLRGFGGTAGDILANDNTAGPAVVTIGATDAGFESARCSRWTQDLSAITASPTAPFPGDGTYIVGTDIAPGTWQTPGTDSCYWARLSGFGGTTSSVIANANPRGQAIVTIAAGDKGFETARCGTWTRAQ